MSPYAVLEVLDPGPLALVEDLGRPGMAQLGVSRSGAADRSAFLLGGRLLGQGGDCAAVETVLGGLVLRAQGSVTAVLTGAPCRADLDGSGVAHAAPFLLGDGQLLRVGRPSSGLRTYLSVRGGIDVAPVLGSRSTDTLSGLGPAPLQPGVRLPVGQPVGQPVVDLAPLPAAPAGPQRLRATPGPRDAWLADRTGLATDDWQVSPQSDRVGVRLTGRRLAWHASRLGSELPSEGVVRGAVQVPPDGQPIIFLADHPVTGGYPVVAVLREGDVDRAAQARPGQRVRVVLR